MRAFYLYILFFSIILPACRTKDDNITMPAPSGRIYYKNRFVVDSSVLTKVGLTDIYIRKDTDPKGSYIAKITSDPEGYFYLDTTDLPIILSFRTTQLLPDNSSAVFYGELRVTSIQTSGLQLVAVYDTSSQHAMQLRSLDVNGSIVPGATITLYSSSDLAVSNNPAFAVKSFSTDSFGYSFRTDIPAGTYYLNANRTIDTLSFQRIGKSLVINNSVIQDTIQMARKTTVINNGFTMTLKDSLGGLMAFTDLYMYNSLVLANSNNPLGAIDAFKSDKYGIVSVKNLREGDYYLNATKTVDTLTFQRIGKHVSLSISGIVTDTIILKLKP